MRGKSVRGQWNLENATAQVLAKLMQNVVAARVPPTLTHEQFLGCLWPNEVIRTCKFAYPVVRSLDRTNYNGTLKIPPELKEETSGFLVKTVFLIPTILSISVNLNMEEMLCPQSATLQNTPSAEILVNQLVGIWSIVETFNEVKNVLGWLNGLSPAAIKYYWPSLASLLPPSHPFHKLEISSRFPEPDDVGKWIERLKKSAQTVAAALLCPAVESPARNTFARVLLGAEWFCLCA